LSIHGSVPDLMTQSVASFSAIVGFVWIKGKSPKYPVGRRKFCGLSSGNRMGKCGTAKSFGWILRLKKGMSSFKVNTPSSFAAFNQRQSGKSKASGSTLMRAQMSGRPLEIWILSNGSFRLIGLEPRWIIIALFFKRYSHRPGELGMVPPPRTEPGATGLNQTFKL
jgi:hypothetical protein